MTLAITAITGRVSQEIQNMYLAMSAINTVNLRQIPMTAKEIEFRGN
jgi:hypothetical protein